MTGKSIFGIFVVSACLGLWATSCGDDSDGGDAQDTSSQNGVKDTTDGDTQGDTTGGDDTTTTGGDTTVGDDTTGGDDTGEPKDTGTTETQEFLKITYNGNYLMDNAKTADADYIEQHKTSIQVSPAFYGSIGDKEIPYDGVPGVHYEVYGLKKSDGTISVLQMSFDEDTHAVVNPFIQLSLDVSKIEGDGDYTLDPKNPRSRLMIFKVKDNLAFNCVDFVATGSVEMADVVGLEQAEGGAITLHASDLEVKSAGDIAKILEAEGKPVCGQGTKPDTDDKDTGTGADTGSKDTGTGSADTGSATEDSDTEDKSACYGVTLEGCCRDEIVYSCFQNWQTGEYQLATTDCTGFGCGWSAKNSFVKCTSNPDPLPEGMSLECPAELPADM